MTRSTGWDISKAFILRVIVRVAGASHTSFQAIDLTVQAYRHVTLVGRPRLRTKVADINPPDHDKSMD